MRLQSALLRSSAGLARAIAGEVRKGGGAPLRGKYGAKVPKGGGAS